MTRETWVTGSQMLLFLLKDNLVLARSLRERRYGDLYAAASVAASQVDSTMALTHPAQYKALREAITLFHLKGYGEMNVGLLRELAEAHQMRKI